MKGNQPQEPPAAQFYKRKIGAYELIALSDGGLNYPTAMILGNVPPDGASQYDLPVGQMFVPYTMLLVKTEDNLVLNDVGAGDLGNPGDGIFPGLDHRTSRTNLLAPSIRAAGIDPGEIDTVLITHAHPDHVGGLLDAQGNLVFPNARYYVAQKEWDYWMSAELPTTGPEVRRKLIARRITTAKKMLNAITARVTLVQGNEEVAPGVFFEPMFGHTAGHVMVAIAMGSQKAYNIGDVVVQPLFIEHPEWSPAIDMDAGQADVVRCQFFARAAEENALVFGNHLGPFPNLGHIVKRGDAWKWQPIETTG